jgi:hypothetical protein
MNDGKLTIRLGEEELKFEVDQHDETDTPSTSGET